MVRLRLPFIHSRHQNRPAKAGRINMVRRSVFAMPKPRARGVMEGFILGIVELLMARRELASTLQCSRRVDFEE